VAAALVVCLGWGPARGAPARDEAQARNHYQAAMTAYDLGRFDQAIESFTRAHQLDPCAHSAVQHRPVAPEEG
jgi:hypothetical protein